MSGRRTISGLMLAAAFAAGACGTPAQQSFIEQFAVHNSSMAKLQPTWVSPLVECDPRLLQYGRGSFSHEYTAARTETVNYGNGRGIGLIAGDRLEFDFVQPAYIQHNVGSSTDGFGDTSTLVKYRIASGDAKHGSFDVAALLNHSFATGSAKNGAMTDTWGPTLASGRAFKRFDVQSSLGGTIPTGEIATQGRSIAWNALTQTHVGHLWFEVENNATFYNRGSHDGKMQNFITPAVFYVFRSKEWKPTHPFFILDGGMQIATSGFHTYNHNLISEARILF